jgi:hypothetical protein
MKTALCAAAIGVAMLTGYGLSAQPAQAGYIVDLTQQGSNVVATGSGEIDLTGLGFVWTISSTAAIGLLNPSGVDPQNPDIKGSDGGLIIGTGTEDLYHGVFTSPGTFGSGGITVSSSATGGPLEISSPFLGVPHGYVSDSPLSDTATWDSQTLSSLGATPGTYNWTWGTGANQNFTLVIGSRPPAPSEFAFQETSPKDGTLGHYTIANNSAGWWITGFDVENPLAGDPYEPSTTQTDWTASICDDCFGALPAFSYTDSSLSDYANYIGPDGGQSSLFFFGAPPASRVVLDLVNADGQTYQLGLGTPEPSTWAMLMLGFGLLGYAGYRKTRSANALA